MVRSVSNAVTAQKHPHDGHRGALCTAAQQHPPLCKFLLQLHGTDCIAVQQYEISFVLVQAHCHYHPEALAGSSGQAQVCSCAGSTQHTATPGKHVYNASTANSMPACPSTCNTSFLDMSYLQRRPDCISTAMREPSRQAAPRGVRGSHIYPCSTEQASHCHVRPCMVVFLYSCRQTSTTMPLSYRSAGVATTAAHMFMTSTSASSSCSQLLLPTLL